MTLKYHTTGETVTIVARWPGGFTWMAHPDEDMQRASHALVVDEDVWLIDPLDAEGLDEELAALGTVAGVVVLTNSHGRHADHLAARHDVAIHVPGCFEGATSTFDAPVELIGEELDATGFELVWEKDGSSWKEGALYHTDRRTLVIPDTLMTALFTGQNGRLEVLPFFRFSPPRDDLGHLEVERILVGHGEPVLEDAQAALEAALSDTRRGAPRAIARSLPTFARQVFDEITN